MTKIIFYINSINYGGAERVMVNLANEFSKRNYKLCFVTTVRDKEEYFLDKKIERLNLEEVQSKKTFVKRNISRTIKLRKILKEKRPDIIISFLAEPNFRAIMATRFLGIKNLISIRNDPRKEYSNRAYRAMAKLLYPLTSGCVFQTEDARKYFPKSIQAKSTIILNPIEDKFYKEKYLGERKDIVSVGRLEPQKNQELLIEAFSKIADDFPSVNLKIYGQGSKLIDLKKLSLDLGLKGRVIFMGTRDNIQEEIKDAKLFVLSSDYEGLPNALMEAMALGIPVVSTDCPCGGPKMLIEDGVNGLLLKTKDLEGLSMAMRKVLKDHNLATTLSKNASLRAREFQSKKIFQEWEAYLLTLINK